MGHLACDRFDGHPVPARPCVSEASDRAGHERHHRFEALVYGCTGLGSSKETCMGFLLWVGLGASVGYGVAQRRDVSTTTLE